MDSLRVRTVAPSPPWPSPFPPSSSPAARPLLVFSRPPVPSSEAAAAAAAALTCVCRWMQEKAACRPGAHTYLSFVEHLEVESLDLVELESQRRQRVLLLVRVLLKQLHGHLHLLLQAHLELQLTLQLLKHTVQTNVSKSAVIVLVESVMKNKNQETSILCSVLMRID